MSTTSGGEQSIRHSTILGAPGALIRIIYLGTSIFVIMLFLLLCVSYVAYGHTYVLPRIVAFLPIMVYLAIIGWCIHWKRFTLAAWLVINLYTIAAAVALFVWSVNLQIGLLTLAFVVILAVTILNARFIVPVTAGIVLLLVAVQATTELGITHPQTTLLASKSTFGDVIVYSAMFSIFALVTWLSRRRLENALQVTLAAEAALATEKQLLAVRLEEKTNDLRAVQLEEMQQLYRFAEIGQLSTVILHDLANHLTVLTLDIDDIGQRHRQSATVEHAKESIEHLDAIVDKVRRQLQNNDDFKEFSVTPVIHETIAALGSRPRHLGVNITIHDHRKKNFPYRVYGDPLRLSQVVTIILTNALDAYDAVESSLQEPNINIDITYTKQAVHLAITDYAGGISDYQRSQLFIPFKSTKETGMGIGLFIGRKMIETHFKGTLDLDPRKNLTQFIITLPTKSTGRTRHGKKQSTG